MSSPSQSSLDILSMIWNPYQIIQQAVMPYYQKSSLPITIIDLNDHCLMNIYRYLDLEDLIRCRLVCHRFLESIEDYFKLKKKFTYDCQINGISIQHGRYQFNIAAFEFIIQHMPNIQVLQFERCFVMRSALATCQFNLLDQICFYLKNLKELHLGRSIFIQTHSIEQLAGAFPELTHLTITIYNENLLSLIISSFQHLRYLNLDRSILYNYAPILQNLPPSIRIFIPPMDIKNEKLKVLKFLCNGHGINLERLEVRIMANNISQDRHYFDLIGQLNHNLKWFQCELSCSSIINSFKRMNIQEINNNDQLQHEGEYQLNNNINENDAIYHSHHLNLISGIYRLVNLNVLILKEKDYFDNETRCSLFDDDSLKKIFTYCNKLIMVSISCALCCNEIDYAPYSMDRKQDGQTINRILNNYLNKQQQQCDTEKENEIRDFDNSSQCHFESHHNNECDSMLKNHFKCHHQQLEIQSDKQQYAHTITDDSLEIIDLYLPELRILQLRGVRISQRTFKSISNLKYLQFLRLDSIKYNEQQNVKESFSDLMRNLTSGNHNDSKHKTVIHLTNIPLI